MTGSTRAPQRQHQPPAASSGPDPLTAVGAWPTTRRLRAALRANTAFSFMCGLALLTGGWFIAEPWGLGPAVVLGPAGAMLAGFAVLLARLAVAPADPLRRWAFGVVIADVLWVLASAALLASYQPPRPGQITIISVAVIVAGLAAWEIGGLVAMRHDDPYADVEVVETARVFAVPPARVWSVLTDHRLYGTLAPNLRSVDVISEPGQPHRRRCTSSGGDQWEETCSLWEEGRRFAFDVDTAHYPYPIARIGGLWQVDPHPRGSTVTMRFVYQANQSIRGGLFTIGFKALTPFILNRIFVGWRRQARTVQ